jgi:hypothetical protein
MWEKKASKNVDGVTLGKVEDLSAVLGIFSLKL